MRAPRLLPVLHGATCERPDEADTLRVAGWIAGVLEGLGYQAPLIHLDGGLTALDELSALRPDAVFNLVEALDGDATGAALAAERLEDLGLAFTGCDAIAIRAYLSKDSVKTALVAGGLPTPDWSLDGNGLAEGRVIVKSLTEHASLGIDAASVVPGEEAAAEIARRESAFGGSFFAEAFIEGREFNIALLGSWDDAIVLPHAEITFDIFPADRPRIVDYEAKWEEGGFAYENTPRRFDFPEKDRALLKTLSRLSLHTWRRLGLSGYARIDFRVDSGGQPWIVDVNANPCLAPDAGFIAAASRAGLGPEKVIRQIVQIALAREVEDA